MRRRRGVLARGGGSHWPDSTWDRSLSRPRPRFGLDSVIRIQAYGRAATTRGSGSYAVCQVRKAFYVCPFPPQCTSAGILAGGWRLDECGSHRRLRRMSHTATGSAMASAAASRQKPPVGFLWGTIPSNEWGRAHACLETTEVRGCASQGTADALATLGSV